MIYVPELWEEKPGEDNCADKISKTGGNMIGPLDMGNNKITGLSDEYPPGDNEAASWSHVKRYTQGPLHFHDTTKESEVTIDHSGIHTTKGNLRVNVPEGGGPEIEMRQLHYNSPNGLPGGLRIISHDRENHYQLGLSTDGTLTLYAVDSAAQVKEVCKFTNIGITGIHNPINNMDAANKQYVDSKKPVISVWAASNGNINNNAYEWNFGEKGRRGSQRSYPMLTSGRITHGAISVVYAPNANILDPDEEVVQIDHNRQETDYKLSTNVKRFDTPLELAAGDVITFKSIKTIPSVNYATVNVFIEIDI